MASVSKYVHKSSYTEHLQVEQRHNKKCWFILFILQGTSTNVSSGSLKIQINAPFTHQNFVQYTHFI